MELSFYRWGVFLDWSYSSSREILFVYSNVMAGDFHEDSICRVPKWRSIKKSCLRKKIKPQILINKIAEFPLWVCQQLILTYLNLYELARTLCDSIWIHLNLSDLIWTNLNLSELFTCFNLSKHIRTYPNSVKSFRNFLNSFLLETLQW